MFALGKDSAFVTQHIRNLRGGSQPILARASDGFLYVVKCANNLQGPNLLFNESAGSELYRACGLPVPKWKPLEITNDFLDRNPDCWMETPEGRLRPASGLCFGSRFVEGNGRRLFEILPGSMFKRVRNRFSFWQAWLVDVCAEHVDNRQAVFVEDADGWLDAYFIDHGHLFGGAGAGSNRHFRASCYLDRRIYGQVPSEALLEFQNVLQALDVDKLRQGIEAIPVEWRHASALEGFERCLQRLSTPSLVQHLLETIIDDLERRTETQSGVVGSERKLPSAVLRLGLQGSGVGPSYAYHPRCA
jgi:hypothetical protein